MKHKLTRKHFISTLAGTGTMLLFGQKVSAKPFDFRKTSDDTNSEPFHKNFPSQDPQLVLEMVIVSHGQMDKVSTLLTAHPELAKATWDFGYGDWETAIGNPGRGGTSWRANVFPVPG